MTSFVGRALGSLKGKRDRPSCVAPPAPAVPDFEPGRDLANLHAARAAVASMFVRGGGLEIGALHLPLRLPADATVKYVDRRTAADLRKTYPELGEAPLVDPDVLDDGETLATVTDASQDFIVANHFLEHCQNPFRTIENMFRVLKPGGVLFMAVPDKRFTFDVDRPCTTIDHLLRDHREGPEWSKRDHFEEWNRLVNKITGDAALDEATRHLINIDHSIHFHVWGAEELLEFLRALRQFVTFELEIFLRNAFETIFVLRKI